MKNTRLPFRKRIKKVWYFTLMLTLNIVYAQSIDIRPKFFTTNNLRASFAVGGDISYLGKNGEVSLILLQGETDNQNIKFRELANWNVNLGFDIYSPNSILGFFIGAGFNSQKYAIEGTANQRRDSIRSFHVEIPAYLKFRFGKTSGNGHLWWAVGAGYAIPTKTSFRSFTSDNSMSTAVRDIEFFRTTPYISSILGYEIYLKSKSRYDFSNLRLLLYAQANYDLENRVLNNYVLPTPSSLNELDTVDIRFLKISVGLKFLFG